MDTVGKIDRCSSRGQVDDPASRSQTVDVRIEDIMSDIVHIFLGIDFTVVLKSLEPV